MHKNEKVNGSYWYYIHGVCEETGYHGGVTVKSVDKCYAAIHGIRELKKENTERIYTIKKASLLTPLQRKKRGL